MKNFIKLIVGIGLILAAENAAAIVISGTSGTGPVDLDMSMQEIAELLKGYQPDTKAGKKPQKKAGKFSSKINKLQTKLDSSTSDKKTAKLERKIGKKEQRLAALLRQLKLDLSDYLTGDISPAVADTGNIPGDDTIGGQPGNDVRNVPEPSVLALLAVGLIGIGAARYRRRLA